MESCWLFEPFTTQAGRCILIANINPNAKSPLYPGAMRLKQVQNGVQFIALDVHRGNFTLMTLGSEWEARVIPIISGYD